MSQRDMSLDLTPSSDWDGWTPPDSVNMVTEKFTNVDQISDIPTIGSDQDIAELASALADAEAPPQARRQRRKSRKRRQTLSTTGVVAGPTSRRKIPRIRVGGKRRQRKQRRAPKDDLDALSTMATVSGPVSPRKISRRRARRVVKSNARKIPTSTVRQMIRASKGGIWLDSRATLHSLISKIPYAKLPLVQSLRR